jgi:cytochrome P450
MMGDWRADPDGTQAALDGFAEMIEAKRDEPGDDVITTLLAASDEGDQLTRRELLTLCVGVLIGGHETTTNQINMCLLTLLRYPEEMARLRADPAAIAPAVDELTRFIQLGDTGIMMPRVATEEVELSGVRLPPGATILPAFVAANRDPRVFTDPNRLDLARIDNPHLGFGAGIHYCLGAQLVRMELQEALGGLLRRFPDVRVAVPESDLQFKQGLVVRSIEALPVTW